MESAPQHNLLYAVTQDRHFRHFSQTIALSAVRLRVEQAHSYHQMLKALLANSHQLYVIDGAFDEFPAVQALCQAHATRIGSSVLYLVDEAQEALFASEDADVFIRERFTYRDIERCLRNARRQRSLAEALSYRIHYEQLVGELLTMFIRMDAHEVDGKIRQALERVGEFAGVEHASLWLCSGGHGRMQCTHEWSSRRMEQQSQWTRDVPADDFPWLSSQLREKKLVVVEDIALLPDTAERERRYVSALGSHAFAAVALEQTGMTVGCLAIISAGARRSWGANVDELLRTMAPLFVTAFARRNAEHARKKSEIRFRSVVESLNDGLVLLDRFGCIEYVNDRFTQLTGYSRSEASEKRLFSLLVPERETSLSKAASYDRLSRLRGAGVQHIHVRRKDGSRRWMSLAMSPYRPGGGSSYGAVALLTDITDQLELEAQLHQSQKMEAVGRLAGGVAHDFNNFLTAVLGYSGLLLHRLPPESPHRHELFQIRKASEQAGALVHQLLTFSRKQIMTPRVFSLNTVVEETSRMLRRLIGEDISLQIELDPLLANTRADAGQMQQILINLVINARDAMPDGGELGIRTANVVQSVQASCEPQPLPAGSYVMLEVTDNGHGMNADVKARLFEPFFTTKEPGRGTGLGLSTVYGIVESSRGHIVVQSEPGEGTTFRVYLSAVEAEADLVVQRTFGREELREGSETVLLVEDEGSVRSLLVEVLRSSGYAVLEAEDGQKAVEL
ncbi:MAG: PAS domain S-box protein, partial [Bdellovibrionales bacterium]|nr:PAS domain S-box protein [Bdellovibrionales bacterium]